MVPFPKSHLQIKKRCLFDSRPVKIRQTCMNSTTIYTLYKLNLLGLPTFDLVLHYKPLIPILSANILGEISTPKNIACEEKKVASNSFTVV